jgi:hypothetical protein
MATIQSGIGATEIKLAFDADGVLVLAYADTAANNSLKVFRRSSSGGFVHLDAPAHNQVSGLDLAVNTDKSIYVSYASNTNIGGILCSSYNGSGWTTYEVAGAGASCTPVTSLNFGADGTAILLTYNQNTSLSTYTNTQVSPWSEIIPSISTVLADHDIQLLTSGNTIHIFAAPLNEPLFIMTTNLDGGPGSTYSHPTATNHAVNSAACLLDNTGILHTPYIDNENDRIIFSRYQSGWSHDPASPELFPNNDIKSLRATTSRDRGRLFIAWQGFSTNMASSVSLLEYSTANPGWKQLSPPDAGPKAATNSYAIAFNPRDGFVYMAAVVPIHEGAATWDLRLFRYVP